MVSGFVSKTAPLTPGFPALYISGNVCFCPRPVYWNPHLTTTRFWEKSLLPPRPPIWPLARKMATPYHLTLIGFNTQQSHHLVVPVVRPSLNWGTCYRGGYTHRPGCVTSSALQPTLGLIQCVGLQDHNSSATWDYELESCTGSSASRKSDLRIFAPYS